MSGRRLLSMKNSILLALMELFPTCRLVAEDRTQQDEEQAKGKVSNGKRIFRRTAQSVTRPKQTHGFLFRRLVQTDS
jgi:hypothetical protein